MGSVGKQSACNGGDSGLIPGLGRFAGEGIGYPLQYFGASLVAQMVKNLPPVQETQVQSLSQEDPLGLAALKGHGRVWCAGGCHTRGSAAASGQGPPPETPEGAGLDSHLPLTPVPASPQPC